MSFAHRAHIEKKNSHSKHVSHHHDERFDHVMCFGTFDIFHPGHVFYLSESQKFAKKMTIVIARDHRVFSGKGKDPIHNETDRQKMVQEAFPDASVILGDEKDIFAPIRTHMPDVLAFGYDQKVPEDRLHELFPDITILRIEGFETDTWKSSKLREKLHS